MESPTAWLEFPSGERVFFSDVCTIGRSPDNRVVIPLDRVSRKHAVIRRTEDGAYVLIDMGSSNGTFLNGQRLSQTTALKNGAVIEIGLQKITFRTPPQLESRPHVELPKEGLCWLLVIAAVQHYIDPASNELSEKTHESWMSRAHRIVARYRGRIMRGMDDSLVVFWPATGADQQRGAVASTVTSLRRWQIFSEEFRLALHCGTVQFHRSSIGEDAPTGPEVIAAIQVERLASRLNCAVLITAEAQGCLADSLPTRALTVEEWRGSPLSKPCFTLLGEAARLE